MSASVSYVWSRDAQNWRHRATCAECAWAGSRFASPDSAELQARKHNTENHREES